MPIARPGFDRQKIKIKIKSSPLTPALSPKGARGKGADLHGFRILSSTQKFQVGVPPTSNSVSPLSLRERARVRGFWG
jgi:hypothetical protein